VCGSGWKGDAAVEEGQKALEGIKGVIERG
jgi:hypothetical protein